MERCLSNKKSYPTLALAEDALIDARIRYDFPSGHGPISVYRCDECGQHHLTSKGEVNTRLAKCIADGTLDRQKKAKQWLDKLGSEY